MFHHPTFVLSTLQFPLLCFQFCIFSNRGSTFRYEGPGPKEASQNSPEQKTKTNKKTASQNRAKLVKSRGWKEKEKQRAIFVLMRREAGSWVCKVSRVSSARECVSVDVRQKGRVCPCADSVSVAA